MADCEQPKSQDVKPNVVDLVPVVRTPVKQITVNIKTPNDLKQLKVPVDHTVFALKALLSVEYNTDVGRLYLILAGKILNDSSELTSENITDGTHIHLVIEPLPIFKPPQPIFYVPPPRGTVTAPYSPIFYNHPMYPPLPGCRRPAYMPYPTLPLENNPEYCGRYHGPEMRPINPQENINITDFFKRECPDYTPCPEIQYQAELQQLEGMGYFDRHNNLKVLIDTSGNMNETVRLLRSMRH